ncbi:unnamed protein product [Medioppia subpectinata]|uniref:Uncharacterized protein n=1 Tax=Medioppia subpectinata TaxID=1979941 RepID=A0A7R9L606_9ACAR|nr:unnamed protein product [Medioppia subpectinata]CAG2116017.1 unnamed protein product [Medioppia subpectinata]
MFCNYNPFIYCYLNNSFKNGAKKFYHFILCHKRSAQELANGGTGGGRQSGRHATGAVDRSPSIGVDSKTKLTNIDTTKCLN